MAEALTAFVSRRQGEWKRLEEMLARKRRGALALEELSTLDQLYRRASADLAVAQAAYAGTDVARFLNQLTVNAYGAIYRRPLRPLTSMRTFFVETFPQALRENLAFVKVAGALMFFATVVGALTVALDDRAAALLIPDSMLDMIHARDLWTNHALDQHAPSEMATMIFTNNLRVTATAFAGGITAGLLTIFAMVQNGLHVGAVVVHCAQNGLGLGILDFMAAHGPVELSIIAIAGGAGLMMADAMVRPTERPRVELLSERARRGAQLIVGCAPFLTAIGVVEGFVSPGNMFPTAAKVLLGACLGGAFWVYLLRSGQAGAEAASDFTNSNASGA